MTNATMRKRENSMRARNFLSVPIMIAMPLAVLGQATTQKTFSTPDDAVQALVKAAEDRNQDEMLAVLGAEGKELVYSGDDVQDQAGMGAFVKAYKAKHAILNESAQKSVLQVGSSDWQFPIPIVNANGKWQFDTAAGKQELLYRRIGHNELGAIAACRGYIDAQKDYAAVGHDGLPAGIYAQRLMSSPGKQDGLYWETPEDQPTSPAGPLLANASAEGYTPQGLGGKAQPYHGYFYRVLKAQGAAAKGGAKSYLVDGQLAQGVALVAFPAQYRVSGVMTFVINQRGVVYQKDLGEDTLAIAKSMTEYNPDKSWQKVTD
jgi:Protein of unknown function (DUF2950)